MAQHNNFKNDIDMLSEAYSSVSGSIPATSTTAMPHMLNEEFKFGPEHTQAIPVEIKDEVQAKVLEIAGKPLGQLSMTEYEAAQKKAHELYKKEGKDLHVKHLEQSLDFLGNARDTVSTAYDKATAEDAEHDEPSQEFFDLLDDVRMEVDDYHDVIDKLEELLGRKLSPLEVEWVETTVYYDEEQDEEAPYKGGNIEHD